jgi:hypothetical protein
MPEKELTAQDLISLGVNLWAIREPQEHDPLGYHSRVSSLIYFLEAGGFTNTLNIARPMREELDAVLVDPSGPLYNSKRGHYSSTATAINRSLEGEAKSKTLILTDEKPPQQLTNLTGLEPHQEALRQDLMTCLKAHLARPAIVMAWALGYDLIRSWVFNDPQRLQDFNNQLRNPQIADYHDFFAVGEQRVLETCRDAVGSLAGFTGKTFRTLHGMLDDRNNFAHANYAQATPAEATVYVERLVRVVTGPPFV